MKSSKLFITSLLAAAAMGTSAYATSLSDATLAIESFTTENITALGTAGWTVSGITISGTDGTFTTTETTGTPLSSITAAGSSNTLSTNVSTGSATARYTFSTIVTVDASLFSGTDNGNIIAGSTISNGSVSTSSAIGVGFSSGNIIGTWGGNGYNTQTSLDVSNSIVNGKVTIGLVFAGETGANLYLADGSTINLNGLKSNSNYEAIILSNKAVTYSNLYWFNTALSESDMQTAVIAAAGVRLASLTWAGGTSGTWDYTSSNWTMSGETGTTTTYQDLDSVTFDTADASISLGDSTETYFSLKGLTVSAATSLTGTGTIRVDAANLTTTAALTLGENVVLDLGSISAATTKTISGTGTVKVANVSTEFIGLSLDAGFMGTIDHTGNITASNFGNNPKAKYVLSSGKMWGGRDLINISNDICFANYQIGNTGTTKVNFTGALTQAAGTTLTIGGNENTVATFGDTANLSQVAQSAGTLNISGAATFGAFTQTGGALSVGGTGTLDVSGATLALASGISNAGGITVDADTNFRMSQSATSSFSIISGSGTITGWDTLGYGNFTVGGAAISGRSTLTISANEIAYNYVAGKELTWNGGATGGTWTTTAAGTTATNTPWQNAEGGADGFYAGDYVTFDGDAAVAVDAAGVSAGKVTVASGTVSFSGGTITSAGGVAVTGGKLNISTNVFAAGTAFNVSGGALTLGSAFALTAGTSIDVSDAGTLSGTISSMAVGSSLTLAGTTKSTVALSGDVCSTGAANKVSITVLNGNEVTYTKGSNSNRLNADITVSGAGSKFTQLGTNAADQLATGSSLAIRVSDGGELALGSNRWEISGTTFYLDGGTISGTRNGTAYGNLDFNNANNTVYVTNDNNAASTISASIRLRNNVTFNVADGATLNITGKIGNVSSSGTAKVIKIGTGTLTLDIANSSTSPSENFVGGLNVNAGKVIVKNTDALGTGTTRGTVTVANVAVLELAAATGTVSNVISGAGAIKKTGTGTVTLAGSNTSYSGQMTIEGGTLVAGNASALGTGNVVVADGATLKYGASSGAVSIGGTLTTNGAAMLDLSASDGSSAAFAVTGAVALSGDTLFNVAVAPTSAFTLLSTGSTLTVDSTAVSSGTVSALGISNLYVGGFLANQRDGASATFSVTNGVLTLDSCTVGTTNYSLSWNGGAEGTWKANGSGWQTVADSPAAETFQTGDTVTFTDVSAGAVTVDGNISVAAMTIDSASDYAFTAGQNGAAIAGTGALMKRGTGTATIDSSVDLSGFTGGIEIAQNGGKLVVDTASGYAGAVTAGANGTFTLNVSSDTTLANTLSGAGTFEKTGAGTLTVSTANAGLTGQFVISEGTVKLGAESNVFGTTDKAGKGTRYAAVVKSGGTLDVNGKTEGGNNCYKIELAGGELVNNGSNVGTNQRQITGLKLSANSTVGGSGNFGLIADGYGENNLELGGFTLTKTGSNNFWLASTEVNNGVVDVQGGFLYLRNGDSSGEEFKMTSSAMLKANGGEIKAGSAGVALGNVAIVFNDANKNTARITKDTNCSFSVQEGAKLYLDIGALTEATLTPGEDVSLTIAAASAIANDLFFSAVEVGTYNEAGSWVKDLQWAYVEGTWDYRTGTLSIAIPEPSVFGLLAGLGALALAGTRRRRKKA